MDWFYGDSIKIVNKTFSESGTYIDGIYSASKDKGNYTTKNIKCDIQPIDTSVIDTDAGMMIDAEYKIYCDLDSLIRTSTDIYIDTVRYNIVKIVKWSDYMILYVKAVI